MPNDFTDAGSGSFDEFLARYLAGEQAGDPVDRPQPVPHRAHPADPAAPAGSRSSAARPSSTRCTCCAPIVEDDAVGGRSATSA
jgi:hypothetical protein